MGKRERECGSEGVCPHAVAWGHIKPEHLMCSLTYLTPTREGVHAGLEKCIFAAKISILVQRYNCKFIKKGTN
ncbi:hypothetical protein VNO80_08945 [Phaseolus coccineus]|uniref:Uncharacterized protein n=1 Tax=Phaseolus coccineus TaxID=3886 RepID=A0AAN9N5U1_PHACN